MNYFELGWDHIVNIHAHDHLLFLLLLVIPLFDKPLWTLIKLVTAFTVGHALTIIIALNNLPETLIYVTELLIPLTIVATGIKSIYSNNKIKEVTWSYYFLVGIFGLIHGLGFAAAINGMMMSEESVLLPLLKFNIGVEIGQIFVLIIIITVLRLFYQLTKKLDAINYFNWICTLLASVGVLIAIWMFIQRV